MVSWVGPSPKMRWRRRTYQSTTLLRLVKFFDLWCFSRVYLKVGFEALVEPQNIKRDSVEIEIFASSLLWFWKFRSIQETAITRTESDLLQGSSCSVSRSAGLTLRFQSRSEFFFLPARSDSFNEHVINEVHFQQDIYFYKHITFMPTGNQVVSAVQHWTI